MLSNLTAIIERTIGNRQAQVNKEVYGYATKARELEKKIDSGQIKSLAEVMQAVRNIFSWHLSKDDYRKIEKELEYSIK